MKQYLMMCDDRGVEILKALFRPEMVQFLEVQGMAMSPNNTHTLLVTPVLTSVTPAVVATPEVQEAPGE